MKIKLLVLALFGWVGTYVHAQQVTITGTVKDEFDMPLPGASVLVKGTSRGTQTDFDGNFSLDAEIGETLVISYVGLTSQEVVIKDENPLDISLSVAENQLDEVVVIGYGTTTVKDLTSAISTVKSEEIQKVPTGQAMQALQGKVAGLQVVNAGSPGKSPTVRIRGIGSYDTDASGPLYVVDGAFFNDIDFLNPSDIASMSVLKDASAAAIYGVRAANGVVLIETKSGTYNQKPEITYDGYSGIQVAQNVLKVANSEQFATIARESGSEPDEQFILNAMQRYGRSRVNPNVPAPNTDWYKEIIRHGFVQNHNLGVTGGSEQATYALGASYFGQEGILKMKNEYERFNLRSKIDFKANDWMKIGGNVIFSNATRYDPEESAWRLAYYAVPTMPVLDPQNTDAIPIPYANAQDLGYRGGQNPFPTMDFSELRSRIREVLVNFYAEFQLVPSKLTFRTAYNHNFTSEDRRELRFSYYISENFQRNPNSILNRKEAISNQIWDNTLTYTDSFGNHNLTAMIGTSYRDESFEMLRALGNGFPETGKESYYLDQAEVIDPLETYDDASREFGFSYFTRISYNYDNRYLLYGTFRADGTNKYQEKWGYFPTVGAGWVVTEEDFMDENGIFDYLKIRGSWGKLGNDKVPSSEGSITSEVVYTALGDVRYSGLNTSSDFTALKWEVTEEINAGLSARFFGNDLSLEFDYFRRDTKDAVIPVERALIPGTTRQNVGKIRNSGFEVTLDYNKVVSPEFSYYFGVNFSTLKNEVLDLGDAEYIDAGSAEFRQRSMVGEPIFAFFGREIEGVYQTQAEVDADPVAVANNLAPGDFKYKDLNGDGDITDDDRTVLGSYLPTYYYGFNLGFTYKNLDFSLNALGQGGNHILNRKRGEVIFTNDTNVDRDFAINRWHGEGTTNSYPSAAGIRKGWNQRLNDYFVEEGGFFRIQNITVGYTINRGRENKGFPQTRIYLTAEKPLTVFDYNGFNPEVPDGVDNQTYPIPAVYTIGVNFKI
ncbi:SusC/RagA family TonB-linked outer membrane protein [Robertkochia solimangrovi]|uniref:SusC/RagA family TonB-linked outer membrane protein n=1 Tax=Robertkochia solimangrovi TaxID=2213046 RepID=UPI00117F3B48|nr:TonB-dependent receptor [Robertkochia solimangrovi]TRZ43665.1 TonB-dependent receptor [Robertkochia solimangrovi]